MRYFLKYGMVFMVLSVFTLVGCSQQNDLEGENQRLAEELQELRDIVDALAEDKQTAIDEEIPAEEEPEQEEIQSDEGNKIADVSPYGLSDFLNSFQGSWSHDGNPFFSTWTFFSDGSVEYSGGVVGSEAFIYEGYINSISRNDGTITLRLMMTGGVYEISTNEWELNIYHDQELEPVAFLVENLTWESDILEFTKGVIILPTLLETPTEDASSMYSTEALQEFYLNILFVNLNHVFESAYLNLNDFWRIDQDVVGNALNNMSYIISDYYCEVHNLCVGMGVAPSPGFETAMFHFKAALEILSYGFTGSTGLNGSAGEFVDYIQAGLYELSIYDSDLTVPYWFYDGLDLFISRFEDTF